PTAANGGSQLLGGTQATVDSTNIVGVLRYKMDNGFGVHGGIRSSRASADVTLSGRAYGALSGYSASLDTSTAYGWLAGASYERPDIALRVALTYNSPVTHKFDTVETIPGAIAPLFGVPGDTPIPTGTTEVTTPRAWNLDVQTGVAADTLVFGGIRWVKWSEFKVRPPLFSRIPGQADGLVSLEDTTTYTLGVGRKFTDQWSGAASVSWEPKGDDLVSPLAPTNGRVGMTLAAIYTVDNMKITTGINYTKLGDANPETAGMAQADMTGNSGLGIGVKIGMSF
ncbi:MAG: outer membrane protein transport protein, partial [Paracoccus sp. (in: a-proteobacteria)]|nr:outer membrane protein transport protein [Paracoccus sp. (in: a-proteobacteria)]